MSRAVHKTIQQPKNPGSMISSTDQPLTVGDIRDAIAYVDDDVEISFGSTLAGDVLRFYRFKWRGDMLLQMELNEEE
ncbi:hypothetical protein [Tritonibacter scottomollicae]|uniref:Uncharacterized protein n=1 Tax=Tritonibacter scottomollicae TaxID=483013 RepID=A0A2T0ZYK8_TRISK|nr:hypothetical protein [Tritonibacter scottomollicae]PRZ41442.1 hypothetical protein CLV89_1476 [Tritonibacter scottomollicae]